MHLVCTLRSAVFAELSVFFCFLCLTTSVIASESLAFALEIRRSEERLVKIAVSSDGTVSTIRCVVLPAKTAPQGSAAIRDSQRSLTADESARLAELVAALKPPVPRRETMAEGSVWVFKNIAPSASDDVWSYRSPTFKPKERQVDAVRALGEYIWTIEALRRDAGRLF